MYCDLHFHTYYSTGANGDPRAIMPLMAASDCKGFASSDHDALGAIPIFQKGAAVHGLDFIPGVEVSTNSPEMGNMHILGYGFDPDNGVLIELLAKRITFNHELYRLALDAMIANRLIPDEALFREYWLKDEPDKQMTTHHVSWWLLEQGHAPDLTTARAMFADAIREHAREKTEKLPKYYNSVNQVEVIIDGSDGGNSSVEIIARAEHSNVFIAKESGDDTLTCIDMAVHKLERQLRKKKEKQRNNKHIPGASEPETDMSEAS